MNKHYTQLEINIEHAKNQGWNIVGFTVNCALKVMFNQE